MFTSQLALAYETNEPESRPADSTMHPPIQHPAQSLPVLRTRRNERIVSTVAVDPSPAFYGFDSVLEAIDCYNACHDAAFQIDILAGDDPAWMFNRGDDTTATLRAKRDERAAQDRATYIENHSGGRIDRHTAQGRAVLDGLAAYSGD